MKKLLSVFLAIMMALGVLTVAIVPAAAISGSGTKSSPYMITTMKELSTYLAKSGTQYLKVANRLYDEDTTTLKVNGTKYLDLNGFEVKRFLKSTSSAYMFDVSGTFYVNDSSASPKSTDGKGKISFDNWVWSPDSSKVYTAEFVIQRNIVRVLSGGTFVLNQGKLYPGSSEKYWMYDAHQLTNANKVYNGNARVQINGIGVLIKSGGKYIQNGGHVEGRGYAAIDISNKAATRDCAVKVYSGGTAEINGGEVIGMGCADAFQTAGSGLTVRAGFFNTEKIDAVWAARSKYKIAGSTAYRNTVFGGSYGKIGIPDSAYKEGFNNKNIAVEIRGSDVIDKTVSPWKLKETTNSTEKRVEVKPIDRTYNSFTTTSGKTFGKLTYIYGIDFYLTSNAAFYFPVSQPVNNSDFQINVISGGKIVKTAHFTDSKVNIKNLYNFTAGQTYYLSGYVTQRWNSNDYVVISELSTITLEVTENEIADIDLSWNSSSFNSSGLLKVGSGLTLSSLNIKSKTAGVTASINIAPKLGRDSISSADPVKDNGSYYLTVTLTPASNYKLSTKTKVTAFGQTVNIGTIRGSVGQAVFSLKAECTHPTKSSSKDKMYHYTNCSVCGKEISKGEHTFGTAVVSGSKTTYTCKNCSYSYTLENGREAVDFVGLSISGGQPAAGDKIPTVSLIMSEYWGKRYTVTYQWYKGSVAAANKVQPGAKFEKGDYYLVVTGKITDSSKYYFTSDAYAAAFLYTDIVKTTHTGETELTTTIKVTPLPTATGTLTFPDAPMIGDSLYETVKKFSLTAKADDGSAIEGVTQSGKGNWMLWIFEQEKDKPQITYCVSYDAAKGTFEVEDGSPFTDITNVKIRGDVKYSFTTMGCPIGYSFHDVKISGGKGADTAEFLGDFLGVKGLFAGWEYTPVSELNDIAVPVVTAKPGEKISVTLPSGLPYKWRDYSIVDNAVSAAEPVPCGKAFTVEVVLLANEGYHFAEKDKLLLNTSASNVTVKESYGGMTVKLLYTFKAVDHTVGTVRTTKATCTAAGKETGVCMACGKTITLSTTAKLGHKYETTTVPATEMATGYVIKKCVTCGKQSSKTTVYKASSIKLSKTEFTYNGKAQKPTVTVKDSKGNTLKSGTDYSVKYSNSKSKSTGRYTVTITFKGKYTGEKVLSYTIVPKKVSGVKAASSAKKNAKVTFTKATGATGYEIYYSTKKSSGFKKLTTTTKTSYTKKTLKSGKTYYFKVRAYKTVSGEKLYGSFSDVVSKKIK